MNTRGIDEQVLVRSSSIGLGAALLERARAGIARTAAKYFGRLNAATVYVSRDGRGYRCTVNIDMGAMRIVTGEALDFRCHAALDAALRKAATQLRRLKRALRDDKLPRSGPTPGGVSGRRDTRARRRTRWPASEPPGRTHAPTGCDGFEPEGRERAGPPHGGPARRFGPLPAEAVRGPRGTTRAWNLTGTNP